MLRPCSILLNAVNIFFIFSGEIPIPVSFTFKQTSFLICSAIINIYYLEGVNFKALLKKFSKIYLILLGSDVITKLLLKLFINFI